MSREDVQTNLRLPTNLKDRLTEIADASNRSFSAEVSHRLERSVAGEDTAAATRSNMALLRALADFVVLREMHPEAMEPMREPILRMANAIRDTRDDTQLMTASAPALKDYMLALVAAVEEVTAILGPGWAKNQGGRVTAPEFLPPDKTGRNQLSEQHSQAHPKPAIRKGGSLNKIIIVGNLGREPADRLGARQLDPLPEKKPPNKGPTRSPNARKPKP